jgi:hypothetical protein
MKFSEFLSNYFIDDSSYIVGYNAEADVNIKIPILTLIGILSNITGTGTENMGTKWSGPQTLTDSSFFDNGNLVKTLHGTTTKGLYLDFANSTYKLGNGGNNGLVILPSNKATFSSSVTATEFIKLGGLSTEFLKADGTVDTNAYQKEITLTTIGSTGPATLIGDVLNIPDYASTLGTVLSVNDQLPDLSGNVSLTTTNIPQGTNLYYTNSLARLSLSSIATGLTYTNTTGVFSLTAGYAIPTTTEITNWNNIVESAVVSVNNQTPDIDGNVSLTTTNVPQGTNLYYTDSKARLSISSSATGLTYTSETGIFSLTAGYAIPTTTEITTWNDMVAGGVTIATDQTITGVKTFTKDILFGTASIGRGLTPANNNLVFGIGAGANITQAETIAIGRASMGNSTGGYLNIGIGLNTLYYATGSYNIALGGLAMQQTTTGEKNLAMGYQALFQNTIGNENFALGYFTLNANTSGSSNIGIGANSVLTQNTIGSSNIAIGSSSMTTNISGNLNVGIGISSLSSNTIGSGNVAIGAYALRLNSTGDSNVGIGQYAGWNNSTGIRNTSIGEGAGYSAVSANPNYGVHIGFNSGYINSGSANTSLGYSSGRESSGSNNIFIGYASGYNASSGSYNVVIGSYNLPLSSQSNTLAITDGQSNVKIYSPDTHNIILGGTTDNGLAKLQVTGAIYAATIANTTTDTNKYLVSDGGVVKYITGTQLLAFIGGGVGTVTSVDMSVPTGLSISGNPITTTGTLALTYTAGYSIPTNSSQTNWDTAYTNRITSLTTTGASGSATLISNTLNVPTYTLAGLGGVPSSSISGTSGYIAKFGASNTLADSIISDNGSIVTVGGGITANGDITVNNLNDIVFYDTTLSAVKALINNNQLFIGTSSGTKDPGFTNFQLTNSAVSGLTDSSFAVSDQSMSMSTFVNSAVSEPRMETEKARGTFLVPLPLSNGDDIGGMHFRGLGASGYKNSFMIRSTAVGAESSGVFPTETKFYNRKLGSTGGTIPEIALTIDKYNIIRSSSAFQPGRLTTTERNALTGLVGGEIIYNTTVSSLQEYSGGVWSNISSGGTVTSVDMSVPTGLSISGNPITSSGTLALTYTAGYAIPTTSSQTNWDTAYTNRITSLTTTGSSGSATLIANTLNIPTYTLAGLGGISLTSLSSTATGLTYSNTTGVFSLTSGYVIPTTTEETNWNTAYTNRITSLTTTGTSGAATLIGNTLNIPNYAITSGTVTSVDMTVPTGLSISGNPITSSGTFALTYTAGYSIPTNASQTNWDTAYTNRITSLTTTGASGSATLIGNVLNIPTYTLSGLGGITLSDLSSTATGLTYNNTTGVFSLTSGYVIPTTTEETNWDTAYTNRITSLTTTGSSGAATLISNVLNIPNYTLSSLGGVPYTGAVANVDLGTHSLTASDLVINHASGSGVAASITKGGAGEALTVVKSSGSGNAASITGGTTLISTLSVTGNSVITGNLTVDTNTFFVDSVNNRVAIGTTSPLSSMMHLYGAAGASAVRWSEAAVTVGFIGGANGLVTGKNGSFMVRGEAGLVLSGVGNGNNLYIDSTGDIQTNGATDTGEHFIIGGSGRINGTATITGAVTGSSTAQFTKLGLGNVPITGVIQRISGSFNEAYSDSATYGILNDVFLSTAPTVYRGFTSSPSTNTGGTLTEVTHFRAAQGAFVGTPALQVGYQVSSLMVGATLNYGFQGLLAAATGRWNLYMSGTASNYLAGALGIGTNSLQGNSLTIGKSITGATTVYNVTNSSTIQSDVTSTAQMYRAEPSTNASAFTIATIVNYQSGFGTKGAGSTITDFIGYNASDSSVATNTYGFKGNVASGTGKWNIYMGGTANNYLAGNLAVGSTSGTSYAQVSSLNTTYGTTANLLALGTFDGTYNPRVIVSYTTSVGNPALLKFASTYSSGWGATNYSFESGIFMIGSATAVGTAALQVTGVATFSSNVNLSTSAAQLITTYAGVTTTRFFTDTNGGVISVDGGWGISLRQGGVSGTNMLTFAGATRAATFSSSVGINGATPLAPLHVKGNSSSSYNGFFVTTNTYNASVNGSVLRFGHVASSGDTVAIIENLTAGGTGAGVISITPSLGRVLIGKITDDGSTKLQVSGSASISSTLAVLGATTLSSTLAVTGAVTFSSSVTATSFVKTGSSDSFFLLGGGGTVATSSYQGAITLTTTGTSGVATLIGNTLNIPNYASGGGSGTVTSVDMTVPTGLSISGNPITTTGTLALTYTAGYAIPTTAKQTQWDTAYTNRITSLTVTGSSGAATLVANVLNIPTYTLAGLGGQPLDATLTALAAFNTNGIMVQTAADTFTGRTITGTANQVTVTNGNGVSGNPVLALPQDIHTGASPTFVALNLTTGNLNLGTSSNAGVVNMYNATSVPSASITNGVILYAQDVDPGTGASSELKVRDEAGNITTLSPHNFSLIPNGPSEELAWSYYSEKKGKKINVDMLKLARLVESLTDEQLVFIQ